MLDNLIGASPLTAKLREGLMLAAQVDANVLITGEAGAGKSAATRLIHINSARKDKPLVSILCGGLPDKVLQAELFGTERDPEAGAKQGVLTLADGGTLVLDDIEEMGLQAQADLANFLEARMFHPVDSRTVLLADVRIIATTTRDLSALVRARLFRADLFYRINIIPVRVPSLRERVEDIPDFVDYVLAGHAKRHNTERIEITSEALFALAGFSWPGNFRQLESVVQRLAAKVIERTSNDTLASSVIGADDVNVELLSETAEQREDADKLIPRNERYPDFEIRFPSDCPPEDIKKALTALADYYRACGGVGLKMAFETEDATVLEPAHV